MLKFVKKTFSPVTAMALLVVFTFTTCTSPFYEKLPTETTLYALEIGKGTPKSVNLDSNFNYLETPNEASKATLMWIEDNELAKDVYVLAVTGGGNENDSVQLVEKSKNIKITFFFNKNSNFPWAMDIDVNSKKGTARLSAYNEETQTYSIAFQVDDEYATFTDLMLNKNILNCYVADAALSAEHNIRLRNITTALGLYGSLAQNFQDEDQQIVALGWNLLGFLFGVVRVAVSVIAFVAVVVTIIVVPLQVFTNPIINIWVQTMEYIDELEERLKFIPPPPPVVIQGKPIVTIEAVKTDGTKARINPRDKTPIKPKIGEELVYKVTLMGYAEGQQLVVKPYDPDIRQYLFTAKERNADFFTFKINDNPNFFPMQNANWAPATFRSGDLIKVYRNTETVNGYGNGLVSLVFNFGVEDVVINDIPLLTTDFYLPDESNQVSSAPITTSQYFLLNFSQRTTP